MLRYGNVFGLRQNPHREAGVVTPFREALLRVRPVVIKGEGAYTRDSVPAGEVIRGNLPALNSRVAGRFNADGS